MFGPRMMKEFFGGGHKRGFGPRQGRVFEKGDLKYVILDLIKDEPSHGYELIRAIEERFRGLYSPSPGSVYPTLQLLEDLGYVTVVERDGKKVYTITEQGREFLEEHQGSVDEIWDRAGRGWEPELVRELHEIKHELGYLGRLFGRKLRAGRVNPHRLRRVREVIVRAARDIEGILEEPEDTSGRRV